MASSPLVLAASKLWPRPGSPPRFRLLRTLAATVNAASELPLAPKLFARPL